MKVLFITHRYPPHNGGIESHVYQIGTRLVEYGHEVTVFSADAGSDHPTQSVNEGVQVRRFHSFSASKSFYVAPQMALTVRQFDADIVHAHNYHAFPLFFAALGATNAQFIATTHYHGESANGVRDTLLSLYHPLGRWAVRQANDVIAVSDWEKDRLYDDFGVDATVIPNGLDVDRYVAAESEIRDSPYLLCVGRIEEYKGVQHVIRALPELPEYELVVAGSGPYSEELKQIAKNVGVFDRVDFLGYVNEERLPGLYAGADVYVTLSEFESYGMTVAEALAAGTPSVVRAAGALQDWCDNPGVVCVEREDSRAIAAACRSGRTLQATAEGVRSWDDITGQVLELYEG